jgi:hypothetical protein
MKKVRHRRTFQRGGYMEQTVMKNRKGGRPRKPVKKDQTLTVHCTLIEAKLIIAKSKKAGYTASEYLCGLGVNGKIDIRNKALPKEVLQLTGTLNHLAANLNQIAKKRNGIEELNALERSSLEVQSRDLKKLADEIKNYLK